MTKTGMFFEDLEPGYCAETPARVITAADIDQFAVMTGDNHPLHLDETYAACTAFGGRIAQGALILSIATGLAYSSGYLRGTIEAFVDLNWKYRAPIRINDAVHVRMEVVNKRRLPEQESGLVIIKVTVFNQHNETVQDGRWTLLIRSRNGQSLQLNATM